MAVRGYVLIIAEPGKTIQTYQALRKLQNVIEVFEVLGPYDIVVKLEAEEVVDIARILSTEIRTIDGIQTTTSLISFPP